MVDLETDPFKANEMVHPFVAGFYDGERYITWWCDDCCARFVDFLKAEPEPLIVFAHNGGRFDFFYFVEHFEKKMRIINGRILQAFLGKHEFRDSFALLPFALEKYQKTKIDYQKFTKQNREANREEIIAYLRTDCVDLHTLVKAFIEEFGNKLTVGAAAMAELQKYHTFSKGDAAHDARFREKYYYGGRVQTFQSGIIEHPVKLFDVNSMYPSVMKHCLHPVGVNLILGDEIDEKTAFVTVEGENYGAFPKRQENGSLSFSDGYGTYSVSIHEFRAAAETGTFKVAKVKESIGFAEQTSFDLFVDHFYDARNKAKAEGDKIHELFYKFILNSGYGKFAQNPENFSDYYITELGHFPPDWHDCNSFCDDECCQLWSPCFISHNEYIIWKRPIREENYYNIATGASITGAARAQLLRGLCHASDPIYCDTDSIICTDLTGVTLSDTSLGAWKLEATGHSAAVAGKKLYAIYDEAGSVVKKAHKGARLSGDDIRSIAAGAEFKYHREAPSFKWDGSHHFITRRIKRTGTATPFTK